jgi:pentatricopeptide repeat-containing protein PET309
MGCEIQESDAISSIQARPTKVLRDPHISLEGLFNLESKNDYEEAWRLYELCNGKQRQQSLPQLLAYLSTSHRSPDAERCAHLFQSICETAGPDDFRIAIQAYLRLGNVSQAMYLHQKSLKKHKIQSGSDMLLAQAVESSQ